MTDLSDRVASARKAAASGKKPHEIVGLLFEQVKPRWNGHIPRIDIEQCLMRAFNISLRVARDIEPWKGFDEKGDVTNQAIDQLLEPWISRYLEANSQ